MQAMSAMNGMLEGHRLGRDDLYKKEKYAYEANQKALKTQIDMLTNRFKLRMEQGARDLTAATEAAKTDALEAGASFIAQHVSQFGLNKTSEYLNGLQNLLVEQQKHQDNLAEKARARQDKIDQFNTQNETRLILAGMKGGFGVGPSAIVEKYVGSKLPSKEAATLTAIGSAIGEANSLAYFAAKNPALVGRSNQMQSFVDRYIKSLTGAGETPSDAESGLNQDSLLFAKRYASYLVNYERSLAGGAKGFTVAFQKRFNELMKQEQFTPQGFVSLMKDQSKELARQAASVDNNANLNNLSAMGADIQSRSGDEDAIASYNFMTGSKQPEPTKQPAAVAPGKAQPQKYTLGQKIVRGNKTYEIIGLSNPDDPDVREVK